MKRVRVIGIMSVGLLMILAALLLSTTQQARAAGRWLPRAQTTGVAIDPSRPDADVLCSIGVTTTDSLPGNTSPGTAAILAPYVGLSLVTGTPGQSVAPRESWFILGSALPGFVYAVTASPDGIGNYNLGMIIYSDAGITPVYTDTNVLDGYSASFVDAFPGTGPYYFKIFQASNSCSGGTFRLTTNVTGPTSTPTRTPTPTRTITGTPAPFACTTGSDKFEPNNDFDTATTIGLGVKYDSLNFVECVQSGDSWDNDYFKVRVKPGMKVTCRTLNLSPGTDTNLILYDVNMNGINGQDDFNRAAGDLSSSVSYYVTFEGWLYGLIGEGFHRPQSEQAGASYSYECTIESQYTPTPAPTATDIPGQPTRTPVPTLTPTVPPSLTPSPTLSPTPPFIKIVPLPTVTPAGLPGKSIPVSLQVYYDTDSNNKPDPGEGVVGVSARVYDLTSGNLLAQGLTDQNGRVNFTVIAPGAVQLVVPYFNFSTLILPSAGGSATIRISPHELPRAIP